MKKTLTLLILTSILLVFSSCKTTNLFTIEKHLKTTKQAHENGNIDKISFFPYMITNNGLNKKIQICGYEYNNNKGLIINVISTSDPVLCGDNDNRCDIVDLNEKEINLIIEKYTELKGMVASTIFRRNEILSIDFTLKHNFYFSIRANSSTESYVNFWINDVKYKLPAFSLIEYLKKFIDMGESKQKYNLSRDFR